MGKATIVSGGTDGKYMVKMDYGKAAQTANLERITKRQTELVGLQAAALQDLNLEMIIESLSLEAVENAIRDYVDAAADASATQQALADAEFANSTIASSVTATPAEKAAAAAAVVAAKTAAQNAAESFKKVPGAHAAALAKLVAAKAKTAKLQLVWQILRDEQTQLQKDQGYWAGLKLEETVQAWCADFTEDATGTVATMEIPGENKLVLIAPAAPAHTASDGVLVAREVQTAGQVFFNAAILPGWQKFKPTYRRGVVKKVDEAADTVDVEFDNDKSSAQNLDINRYKRLDSIPVKYMTCNSSAFDVGDRCVVKFKDGNWSFPTVVGFVENPKFCGAGLSGIIKGGELVTLALPDDAPPGTLPAKAIRSYQPTQQAWEYPLKKDPAKIPGTFFDEAKLAKISSAGTQYAGLCASMFSGLIAKAVQVVMGMGLPVGYGCQWSKCHGIVTAADGKLWLVEISAANGIMAMRLPMATKNTYTISPQDLLRECGALFAGIPSGAGFPTGSKLTAALAAGTVVSLKTADELSDESGPYSKVKYANSMCWSFNMLGSEAHNTCYDIGADGVVTSYHYKIEFAFGTEKTATVSIVEQGSLERLAYADYIPFTFSGYENTLVNLPARSVSTFSVRSKVKTPIFVCHINDELQVVRLVMRPLSSSSSGFIAPAPDGGAAIGVTFHESAYIEAPALSVVFQSSLMDRDCSVESSSTSYSYIGTSGGIGPMPGSNVVTDGNITYYDAASHFEVRTTGSARGVQPWGSRDCYVIFEETDFFSTTDTSGLSFSFEPGAPGDPFHIDPYFNSTGPNVTRSPDRTHIVPAAGTPVLLAEALSPDIQYDERAIWKDPAIVIHENSPEFLVQYSVFGTNMQIEYSPAIWRTDFKVEGSLLADETSPITARYSFIGYV